MPLDHLRHAIEPYVITSDYTLDVTGSDFNLLDHTSFFRIIYFMSLEQTSCHWIGLHVIGSDFMSLDRTPVIGSDFMSLDRTLCHWIELHVIGSDFMSLDRTPVIGSDFMSLDRTLCHWIGLHVIGSDFISLDRTQ